MITRNLLYKIYHEQSEHNTQNKWDEYIIIIAEAPARGRDYYVYLSFNNLDDKWWGPFAGKFDHDFKVQNEIRLDQVSSKIRLECIKYIFMKDVHVTNVVCKWQNHD